MSFGAPPCPSPAEPGWRRPMTTREMAARETALQLATHAGQSLDMTMQRAEAYRAFLMGDSK